MRSEHSEHEDELKRLETGKWRPSSIGGRDGLIALFADGFISIEYGADLGGGVERKTDAGAIPAPQSGERLVEMLDATDFTLTERRFVDLSPGTLLVSYRVTAPVFDWTAYATSVWNRRGDKMANTFLSGLASESCFGSKVQVAHAADVARCADASRVRYT